MATAGQDDDTAVRFVRSPHAIWRATGHTLVAHSQAGTWQITGSAPAVWRALAVPRSVDELVEAVADDLGIGATDVEVIHADLVALLARLRDADLVEQRS